MIIKEDPFGEVAVAASYLFEELYLQGVLTSDFFLSDVTPTDDFLCATLTLYWITQSITSSMRDYWDNRWHPVDPTYVSTPTAFGVFAHQTVPESELPRSYLERLYNIQRWTVFPRGGHFAPAEEPAGVAGDLTAFFLGLS